jgi:chorismate synthase
MEIESDEIEILSGLRHGYTLGSPLQLLIKNRDFENWRRVMSVVPVDESEYKKIHRPRPGHADLAGMLKYHTDDARDILERASARETAMRTALGAIARIFLENFDITVASHVIRMGESAVPEEMLEELRKKDINALADKSPVRCLSEKHGAEMVELIDKAKASGDTVGGVCEVVIKGVPPGIGSHTQWDRKLDGRFAQSLMSIQAVKGVEVGIGFGAAALPGSKVHDEIIVEQGKISRSANNSGGIEGGMSNGENIVLRAAMKPIATLGKPLRSVNMKTGEEEKAHYERSDIAAVAACGVIAESVCALTLMEAMLEKFGGDHMKEISAAYERYTEEIERRIGRR